MPWAFVRPRDPTLLAGRPLLDLGTGDGQTVLALADATAIGIDRSFAGLRAAKQSGLVRVACADASALPFGRETFSVVLAADLFHHLDDERLARVAHEIREVLRPDGRLVAWWYAAEAHPAPDAPRFPRSVDLVRVALATAGFERSLELEIDTTVGGGPPTVGVVAP